MSSRLHSQNNYPKADIVLVCPNLGDGGTQRVVSILANEWAQRGQSVCIITLHKDECAYKLDPSVHLIEIHAFSKTTGMLKKIWRLLYRATGIAKRRLWGLGQKISSVLNIFDRNVARVVKNSYSMSGITRWLVIALMIPVSLLIRLVKYCQQQIDKTLDVVSSFYITLMDTPFLMLVNPPLYLRVQKLRFVIKQSAPPVVVSFLPSANVTTILACASLDTRVVISERNDPARQKLRYPWNKLYLRYSNQADVVTANTSGALHTLKGYVDPHKLKFVPNPLKFNHAPASVTQSELNFNGPFILAVGRLHPQKALDVLISAFAALPHDMSHWQLIIVGQGNLLAELIYLAKSQGVGDRVIFTGQVDELRPYYQAGSVFALPSRHEGMSNSLMEAMNYEMPVIVSDASPGPLELVEHNKTGLVVPVDDVESLTQAIAQMINDEGLSRRLGEAARNRVYEHDLPNALASWEQVIGLEPTTIATSAS